MPDMLAELTGAEIVQHTRGGERLADQLNPKTKMGKRTQEALQNEKWDFVILQEMSNGLITSKSQFPLKMRKNSVRRSGRMEQSQFLCDLGISTWRKEVGNF